MTKETKSQQLSTTNFRYLDNQNYLKGAILKLSQQPAQGEAITLTCEGQTLRAVASNCKRIATKGSDSLWQCDLSKLKA